MCTTRCEPALPQRRLLLRMLPVRQREADEAHRSRRRVQSACLIEMADNPCLFHCTLWPFGTAISTVSCNFGFNMNAVPPLQRDASFRRSLLFTSTLETTGCRLSLRGSVQKYVDSSTKKYAQLPRVYTYSIMLSTASSLGMGVVGIWSPFFFARTCNSDVFCTKRASSMPITICLCIACHSVTLTRRMLPVVYVPYI